MAGRVVDMSIFDTNVLIDAMSGKPKALEAIDRYGSSGISLTIFNRYEMLKGRRFVKKEVIEEFLSNMNVYYAGDVEIEAAADIFMSLERKGLRIDELDVLIAGIAIANNETLVTFDRHFANIGNSNIVVIK